MNKWNILFLSLLVFFGFSAYPNPTTPPAVKSACQAIWSVKSQWNATSQLPEHDSSGTGFFVSPKHLITNFHVVEKALLENRFDYIYLRQKQDSNTIIKDIKGILALSISLDLALLEIKGESDSYLSLNTSAINKEEKHFIVGYPNSRLSIIETTGTVKEQLDELVIPTDNYELSGASGSPLLDANSRVTGVLRSSYDGGTVMLASQDSLKKFIEENQNNICKQPRSNKCLTDLTKSLLKKVESKSATATDLLALSRLFKEGRLGFEQNKKKADDLQERAFQRSDSFRKEYSKALSLLFDKRTEKYQKLAFEIFSKLAEQGHNEGLYYKAVMLYWGWGVEQYQKLAFEIFSQLAKKGDLGALLYKGVILFNGEGVKQDLKQAFEIFSQLAELGDAEALYYKAIMLRNGEGVKPDRKQAFEIFSQLAEQGDPEGLYYKAVMLRNGEGVKQDHEKAFSIFLELAKKGHRRAVGSIVQMLHNGEGVEKDLQQAFKIPFELAKQGGHEALSSFYIVTTGFYYEQGLQNSEQFHEISLKLADLGNPFALLYKGLMLHNGEGVKQDRKQALEIFSKLERQIPFDKGLDELLLELKEEIKKLP